jgi:monofunctional biosynthetic peptidoglycan transglycosylase
MRQRLHEAEKDGKPLRIVHKWVPLSKISKNLIDAVIVAEDGLFYSHDGVDWFEVKESIEKNVDQLRAARGASTITQQLAKNLYLSTSKDPIRKLKELVITFLLEWTLSKNRILEIYLNVIEWGRGVFGVEAAAEKYFGTSAASLTLDQATRLASVIPSPLRHRPNDDSRYVFRRKGIVLRRMEARNRTSQPQTTEESPSSQRPDYQPAAIAPPDTLVPVDSTDSEEDKNNGL